MKFDRQLLIYLPPPVVAAALLAAAGLIHGVLPFLEVLPATPVGGLVWGASGFALAASAARVTSRVTPWG